MGELLAELDIPLGDLSALVDSQPLFADDAFRPCLLVADDQDTGFYRRRSGGRAPLADLNAAGQHLTICGTNYEMRCDSSQRWFSRYL
jgi:hypothetical protein